MKESDKPRWRKLRCGQESIMRSADRMMKAMTTPEAIDPIKPKSIYASLKGGQDKL